MLTRGPNRSVGEEASCNGGFRRETAVFINQQFQWKITALKSGAPFVAKDRCKTP
jgi:hypothetical protein